MGIRASEKATETPAFGVSLVFVKSAEGLFFRLLFRLFAGFICRLGIL